MRHPILRPLTTLLCVALMALLLAPAARAEDEDEGWSEPEGVPAASPGSREVPPDMRRPLSRSELEAKARADADAQDGEDAAPPTPEPFVMPTESAIIAVRKHHNAPWVGNWLAVELELTLAVIGQAGKSVGATITFYEDANERPLRAAMQPYVDSEGNLSVYTQLVPIKASSRLFKAKLKVPYRAFPWPTSGPDYAVRARVRLMSRDTAGAFEVLDRSETSFSIHYEKGCGCVPAGRLDCSRCAEWKWDFMYTWCKIWGDEMGTTPSKVPCLPPPKGSGPRQEWYEGRWRTKGSPVDEMQKRADLHSGGG